MCPRGVCINVPIGSVRSIGLCASDLRAVRVCRLCCHCDFGHWACVRMSTCVSRVTTDTITTTTIPPSPLFCTGVASLSSSELARATTSSTTRTQSMRTRIIRTRTNTHKHAHTYFQHACMHIIPTCTTNLRPIHILTYFFNTHAHISYMYTCQTTHSTPPTSTYPHPPGPCTPPTRVPNR